ncbi:MAG: hypothetical protein IH622_13740 [Ochrobactrum anthropi]|uniref:Calcineurin-like phosphoesterase domain-containing protein n=1 Tax=Brucella anthropi TaxID=529 RepID=A0A8I0N6C9_BRUAN|nr:hypothetical protein [Brucella anthropi]MBE0561860.1 hypothetical protein [Brucella anthropi]
MAYPTITDEQLLQTLEAISAFPHKKDAAEYLGISDRTLRYRVKWAAERGLSPQANVLPGFAIKQKSEKQPDGSWIKQTRAPGDIFKVPDNHLVKGVSALVDEDDRVVMKWVKTAADRTETNLLAAVENLLANCNTPIEPLPAPEEVSDATFTVYPLVDWHIGLMAWAAETGENYDLKIARTTIMGAMRRMIARTPPSRKAVVLGLGDMLHFDGYEPVTSRSGNFLDADGRYPKVLNVAIEMIEETINLVAQKHSEVLVRLLPGNHDDKATVALNAAFKLLYRDNERINFEWSPSRFWWHREGKVFLGATHGDKTKMRDLPLVMAYDKPHDWAASGVRRIYTGHIHHESKIEEGGVIVCSLRTPVAKDAYHSFAKYRSGRTVYSDTYEIDGSGMTSASINI